MARQARLFIPQCPVLIELQGVNGLQVFKTREAFAFFHARVPVSAVEEGVQVHAYCLVPAGVMLLVSTEQASSVGRFIQNLNRYFSPQVRQLQPGLAGNLWEPRFKSTVVQPGSRSLKACFYVDAYAERLGQTHDLAAYQWSSYAAHSGVVNEPWLTDLPAYWQLGNTPFERQSRYRQFSEQGLSQVESQEIHACLHKGWLWSDPVFCEQVADSANRSPRPRPRGRPSRV
mgnify:CR=1 FL=1